MGKLYLTKIQQAVHELVQSRDAASRKLLATLTCLTVLADDLDQLEDRVLKLESMHSPPKGVPHA